MKRPIAIVAVLAGLLSGVSSAQATDYVLALSWEPAFCFVRGSDKNECGLMTKESFEANNLILHGLWPQPESNSYCGVPQAVKQKDKPDWSGLPEVTYASTATRDRMLTYMPGVMSNLDRHEWTKHGTCSRMSTDKYFNLAMDLVEKMADARTGQMIRANVGKDVAAADLCKTLTEDLGAGVVETAELKLKSVTVGGKKVTTMTELWIYMSDSADGTLSLDGQHLAKGYGKLRCNDQPVRVLAR